MVASLGLTVGVHPVSLVTYCSILKIVALYEGVHSRPLPRADALVDPDFNT